MEHAYYNEKNNICTTCELQQQLIPIEQETILQKDLAASVTDEIYTTGNNTPEIIAANTGNAIVRMQAEALKKSEEKYRNIFDNATEGIFQITPEGQFLSANAALARIHGYNSPEELITSVRDIAKQLHVDPGHRAQYKRLLERNGFVKNFEAMMYRKDGTLNWISTNTRVVKDKEGRILYYEGTITDITERKRSEKALKESEELYRTAIEHSNDGVSIVRNGIHIFVNSNFASIFGYDAIADIIGKPTSLTVHPDDLEMVQNYAAKRQRGEEAPTRYEFKGIKKDGIVIYIEVSVANIIYHDEEAILAYFREITERKHAEESLKKAEKKYRDIFENAVEGIFQTTVDGRFVSANPSLAVMLGYDSPDEMINCINSISAQQYVHSDDRVRFKNLFEGYDIVEGFETEMYRKDGIKIWVLINARAVFDERGCIVYYEGTIEDVTKRKQIEETLKEQLRFAQTLIDTVPNPVYFKDVHGLYIGCNKAFEAYHGIAREALIGKSVYDILPGELADFHNSRDRSLFQNPGNQAYESFLYMPDNTKHDIVVRKATFVNKDGELAGLVGVLSDITEHKQMEDAMCAERNRFRALSEDAPFGIVMIGSDGRFDYINPKFKKIFGYTLKDVPNGKEWFRKAYPDAEYRHKVVSTWKQDLEQFKIGEGNPWTFSVTSKDGNRKIINFIPVRLETDEHIMTCEDVTERVHTREAIEASEQTLRAILSASPVGIGLIDKFTMGWANDAAYRMLGYDYGELDGQDLRILYLSDDERERVREDLMIKRESEAQWVRKDGSIIDVLIRVAPLENRNGSMIAVSDDITDKKRAVRALEQSRLELERLDRVKTKAVHHISHELKTPLAVIQGSLRLLRRKTQRFANIDNTLSGNIEMLERHLGRLLEIQQETEKIFNLTREMEKTTLAADCERLWERIEAVSEVPDNVRANWQSIHGWVGEHFREPATEPRYADLYLLTREIVEKTRHIADTRNVTIELEGGDGVEEVPVNFIVLRDTIESLLRNAIENTPDEGFIKVILEKKNDRTWLHVTDYGVGITKESQSYVFDGLYHTGETELYASKMPYSFGAGGKGLSLLKIKIYSQHHGFDLLMKSQRCLYLPTEKDLCPGSISLCEHCGTPEICANSGGTTFSLMISQTV
ncbi:MAG: PAS domain S-box protein [Proteobacteria bacterium]|nr:PAS domain S-box protein [Pseudomonadota bacterium]